MVGLGRTKNTVVKQYRTRREMQRGVNRMAGKGYQIEHQSGDFSHRLFQWRWNRRTVVVTFVRNDGSPAA